MKKVLLIFFIFHFTNTFSQPIEEKIVEAIDSFSFNRPQEKVYIQTDKTNYFSGETVWFKSYVLLQNKPSDLSKIIYTILADEAGIVIQKKMLLLNNGTVSGEFVLPPGIPSGTYYLSSYSLWMLNFPEFVSTKKIEVYNALKAAATKPTAKRNSTYSIAFLPEGGNLIDGLESTVAFKAIDENSFPVFVLGKIIDNNGRNITTFKTDYDGMGKFQLTPKTGESYFAEIIWPGGKMEKKNLPVVLDEGVVLSTDNKNPGKTFIKVSRSAKNAEVYNELLLVAQQNYKVVYMAHLNFNEGLDAVAINKKNLPPGIMQVTLMTMKGIPIAERLVFVANHELFYTVTDVVNTTARSKNHIAISLPGWEKFSGAVSVVNANIETVPSMKNIFTELLLASDLHGNIYQPYKYFLDKTDTTISHLDLLMLTNGWRRFGWENIMAYKYSPIKYGFETSLSAAGTVMESNGKTALTNGKINIIIKGDDSTTIMSEAAINSHSQFVIDHINFQKDATLFYQGRNLKKENAIVSVKLYPTYIDTLKILPNLTPTHIEKTNVVDQSIIEAWHLLPSSAKAKTLEAVILKTIKLSVTDSVSQAYASDIFSGSDQTLVMDAGNYFDIWQYLQRMIPAISINKTDTGMQINFDRYVALDGFSSERTSSGVAFFLNEVPVSADVIDFLNPNDVALIKVYKGATGIAIGADRGAIAVYTTKGKYTRDWRQKGFDSIKKTGFSVNKEFYAPDYSKTSADDEFADIRNTLYWNANPVLKNGVIDIEFYNDDSTKRFKLLLEGMNEHGKLLHIEKDLN